MSLLGIDFNPARPTDGDYVRKASGAQMATEMRDIRTRVKSFFDRVFDVGTGFLMDDVVPSSALRPLSPDPTGTYRKFTLNKKGQFTAGEADRDPTYPRIFRALFVGDPSVESKVDTETGATIVVGDSRSVTVGTVGYVGIVTVARYLEFLFTVPSGVTRISVYLSGGQPNAVDPMLTRMTSFLAQPGDVLRVWAGLDTVSPCRVANLGGTVYCDNTQVESGMTTAKKLLAQPLLKGYGGTEGDPSVVRLEWYA